MAPYIVMIALAAIISVIMINSKSSGFFEKILLIAIIIFTGLRYQIGYDWIAYERYFFQASQNINISDYFERQFNLQVEILYYFLNNTMKALGGNFEFLQFVVSLINILIIHIVVKKIEPKALGFFWLVYIIIALLPIQFNIIRQSISASLVCLSIYYLYQKKYSSSVVIFVISLGFHISSIIFLPIMLLVNYKINYYPLLVIIVSFIFIYILDIQIVDDVLSVVANFLPGIFAQKADAYSSSLGATGGSDASLLTLFLIGIHFVILTFLFSARDKPYGNIAFNLTVMILAAHLLFKGFPSLWNRTMAVSLVFQLPCLWVVLRERFDKLVLTAVCLVVGLTGMALNYYKLSRFEAIAFVPYHSYIQVVLFNDYGDGRQRTEYAIRQADAAKTSGQ